MSPTRTWRVRVYSSTRDWRIERVICRIVVQSFLSAAAANPNGSVFAGLSANTLWYNTALGLATLIGRFLPMVPVLALAGSLARQSHTPESIGTVPTHRPQFVGMVVAVPVILCALTFPPALALGPLAEGIH